MYISVIHDISDPEKFWETVQQSQGNDLPPGVALHSMLPSVTGTRAVCVWQADSVDDVRGVLDPVFVAWSRNEYFEVNADSALGLPS